MNCHIKKPGSKTGSRPQKQGIILKQPIIPFNNQENIRNKIMFVGSQIENDRQRQNEKISFNTNPVIVTRRNISTAQTKNHYYQNDQQDMVLTATRVKRNDEPAYLSHFGQAAKQSFKKGNERPQSKQQPRNKGWTNNELLIKSSLMQSDRPQTSKGQRPKQIQSSNVSASGKRKASLGNEQSKNLNEELADSLGNRKGAKTSRLLFKTSIDAEFLSLFAN